MTMPTKYEVTLARTTWQLTFVFVHADHRTHAKTMVEQMLTSGQLQALNWGVEEVVVQPQVILAREAPAS
jgi:hypothetical protein